MFDFTKEVKLNKEYSGIYKRAQAAVYALAIAAALALSYLIIFPTQYFTFSFPNANSNKNNIINPRNNSGAFAERGRMDADDNMSFDAALQGNYSQARVSLVLDKDSDVPENGQLEVRKAYQAFFYPEGNALGFNDGTLLKNKNNFYIVSAGKLRKFASDNVLSTLGYNKDAFLEAQDTDLKYNDPGEDISDSSNYPDSSIFKIKNAYYILESGKLKKFISPNAFSSQYQKNQAIEKGEDFLNKYPMDENLIGFSDGTLISYGISAFIASSGKILPVNNTITFSSMGYNWDDLIQASGDETSLYQKDKLFTISSPHPNGTIMVSKEDNKWYMILDGHKDLLPSEAIAKSWLVNRHPIEVSSQSLDIKSQCAVSKAVLSLRTYSCDMPLEDFKNLLGKDYEFKLSSDNDIKLESLNVEFKKTASWENLKQTIRDLFIRVRANYVPQNTPIQ